ncbi:Atp25p KNAG_0E02500 [Huiozyma naganishii CBS 8797]|uniref:ATPase synthesis protein 25 n=1 Tax=Huiozyma naganishii (strain ATCC MYA-139 / BCRC 22969 / CBS 8797 / KCTC 17520 / NBRC 10181 / NCYC 3082 / Yp74L-3) TaxID=1071383 RepID=J7R6P1_HUIN7|nr:hypothetical protein KNAG_0E02500 [Kazachstania naganishii CBS 8797]CCK70510.1 hypothetical protein KNAG_0E02500 [Kazachstania naganishii CBS 8797]
MLRVTAGSRLLVWPLARRMAIKMAPVRLLQRISETQPSNAKDDDDAEQKSVPWYLQTDRSTLLNRPNKLIQQGSSSIEYPNQSPASLRVIGSYLTDELGLTDVLIFDMSSGESDAERTTASAKFCKYMVVSTALSLKHCANSFVSLNQMAKAQFGHPLEVEGRLNPNDLKKLQKRLNRRSKLSTKSTTGHDRNSKEAWYMIDCKMDGIIVNILTGARRQELNLEELYAPAEDKHKYTRTEDTQNESGGGDEDLAGNSILTGLRRLAQQRRQYSTTSASKETLRGEFQSALDRRDFEAAHALVGFLNQLEPPLTQLVQITDFLSRADAFSEVDVEALKGLFDKIWPSVIIGDASKYWSTRFQFLKYLNTLRPKEYQITRFYKDFFLLQKARGTAPRGEDLVQMLKQVITNNNANPSTLSQGKHTVFKIVQLYDNESILHDNTVIDLLIGTMTNPTRKQNTASLFEVVDYLLDSQHGILPPTTITALLKAIAATKQWDRLLKFWEFDLKGVSVDSDYRPWPEFLQFIIDSNNGQLLQKVVTEGHLLWLKRYNVPITNTIRDQIVAIFTRVDPEDKNFAHLKKSLIAL